jgi:hypothetical protein
MKNYTWLIVGIATLILTTTIGFSVSAKTWNIVCADDGSCCVDPGTCTCK